MSKISSDVIVSETKQTCGTPISPKEFVKSLKANKFVFHIICNYVQ
jgi:hypothetical protein